MPLLKGLYFLSFIWGQMGPCMYFSHSKNTLPLRLLVTALKMSNNSLKMYNKYVFY